MIQSLNQFADQWWVYTLHATWQAALVTVFILTIVWIFRRLPSPWRYALLLVALVKFSIPPILPDKIGRFGLFYWTAPAVAQNQRSEIRGQRSDLPSVSGSSNPELGLRNAKQESRPSEVHGQRSSESTVAGAPVAPMQQAVSRRSLISDLWLLTSTSWAMLLHAAGTLAVLAWIAIGLYRLGGITRRAEKVAGGTGSLPARALADKPPVAPKLVALHCRLITLSKRLGLSETPDLLVTREDVPPVAYWLLRPKIMLPQSLIDRLSMEKLEAILAHELIHHRRNDWAANWLQLLTCAAWWFNPLVWVLSAALRHTREECCDDALLGENLASGETYSSTLVAAAEEMKYARPIGTTLGFAERLHPVGQRITRILDPALRHVPRLSPPALAVTVLLAVAILPGLRSRIAHSAPAQPIATLTGRVLDENGKPIAGAKINIPLPGGQTTTDSEGRFTLKAARHSAWTHGWAEVIAPGYLRLNSEDFHPDKQNQITLVPNQATTRDFVLKRAGRIDLRVVNEEGRPLEKATVHIVYLTDREGWERTWRWKADRKETDAQGRLFLDEIPPQTLPYFIVVSHADYAPAGQRVIVSEPQAPKALHITLNKGIDVQGLAICKDGKHAAGWSLNLRPAEWPDGTPLQSFLIDSQGRVDFKHLLPGEYNFWI